MNFIEEFKKGQSGGNKGLPMGPGLQNISNAINGVQQGRIYGIASAPKVGKSTFADYGFLVHPWLFAMENNKNPENDPIEIEFIYFSFELDRVSKEFDIAAHFMHIDYGVTHIKLPEGVTKDGADTIEFSSDYLRGRVIDDHGNIIKVNQKVLEALKEVYENRIVPLFGEFATDGTQISRGYIRFIEQRNNPTGIYKYLKSHAEQNGTFIRKKMGNSSRIIGYQAKNPNKFTIIITDHVRKLILERGWQLKQTIDKYIEYSVELRNWCKYTFLHIVHLNRSVTDIQRMKQFGDKLYPNSDDIKDTGNISEDADYVFTMFNPNDSRYNLTKHFGRDIRNGNNHILHPNLRTFHLVESRHCYYPQHFSANMIGGYKDFQIFNDN